MPNHGRDTTPQKRGEGFRVKHVLVADDDRRFRESIRDYLYARGYSASVAEDGKTAVEALNAAEYDLLITDLDMPGINGFALLNYATKRRPRMPTILCTGSACDGDGLFTGRADAVFTKPFEVDKLMDTIDRLTE